MAKAKSNSSRSQDIRKLFGPAGVFVHVAEQISVGGVASIEDAIGEAFSRGTFKTAMDAIRAFLKTDDMLINAPGGRKGKDDPKRPTLTEEGARVFALLRSFLEALNAEEPPATVPLALAVEDHSMLAELVRFRVLPNLRETPVTVEGLLPADILPAFARAENPLDAALIWVKGGRTQGKSDLHVEEIRPAVPLGVVSNDPVKLALLRLGDGRLRQADLRRLPPGERIIVPEGLPIPAGLGPADKKRELVASVADVLAATSSGMRTFGLVPQVPDVIDRYRRAELLDYLPLAPSPDGPTAVSLGLVRPAGPAHPKLKPIRAAIERIVTQLVAGSSLDVPATRRTLSTTPVDYETISHGYYVLTYPADGPVWKREEFDLKVVPAEPSDGGARTFNVAGKMVNQEGTRFNVTGTLISNFTLHLVFDSVPPQERGGTADRVTFVALLPYFQVLKGKPVWHGIWLGRDPQNHAQAEAFVLSTGPLTFGDLQTVTSSAQVRVVPWAPRAAFDFGAQGELGARG